MGRMKGSALGAMKRSAMCMPSTSTASPVAGRKKLESMAPTAPCCTR
jgi:hypothetical protein